MENLANQAAAIIETYKSNPVIMAEVRKEAYIKTAEDIREKTGSGTTYKAVELLYTTNKEIKDRVDNYINAGLIGVFMAFGGKPAK